MSVLTTSHPDWEVTALKGPLRNIRLRLGVRKQTANKWTIALVCIFCTSCDVKSWNPKKIHVLDWCRNMVAQYGRLLTSWHALCKTKTHLCICYSILLPIEPSKCHTLGPFNWNKVDLLDTRTEIIINGNIIKLCVSGLILIFTLYNIFSDYFSGSLRYVWMFWQPTVLLFCVLVGARTASLYFT